MQERNNEVGRTSTAVSSTASAGRCQNRRMPLPFPTSVRRWISQQLWYDGLRGAGFRGGLVLAVAPQTLGVCVMAGSAWLSAFGPGFLADNWVGGLLLTVMFLCAMGLVVFTSLNYEHWLVFFGSFLALSISLFAVNTAVTRWTFRVRGQTTLCTVLEVKERVVTSVHTGADESTFTDTSTYYDHDLRCDAPQVRTMTTDSPEGEPGQRIAVAYDPTGRLDALAAEGAGDVAPSLWTAVIGFITGTVLRVGYVLYYHRPRRRRPKRP
ncbi:MAG: hypothetical protein QOE61_759 [Micromonosporaceae bacterium]|nr:hypothetical protein [Micromonosporaceae bacterium]